jgi:hypothetical protein
MHTLYASNGMFASGIVRFENRYFEMSADYDGKPSRKCNFTRNLQDNCMIKPKRDSDHRESLETHGK